MCALRLDTLKRRRDFVRIARDGKKAVTHSLILQATESPLTEQGVSSSRVGFTVTKKVGNAVVRNRAKRRLRAAVRDVIGQYGREKMDYVVIGRNFCVQCPYDTLLRDLTHALGKVNS